jgi:hypothetical protein
MSNPVLGGAFVDVCTFILPNKNYASSGGEWQEISDLLVKKTKCFRLLIKSFHSTDVETCQFYVGLDIQLFEPEVNSDNMQRIHILHNASMAISKLVQLDHDENTEMKVKLNRMENEARQATDRYMELAVAGHNHGKSRLLQAIKAREEWDSELDCRQWYEDALSWYAVKGDERSQQNLIEAVARELSNFYDNFDGGVQPDHVLVRNGRFPDFTTVHGLLAALTLRIKQGEEQVGLIRGMDRGKCLDKIRQLTTNPESREVYENSRCRRCRKDWNQSGPVCCKSNMLLMYYSYLLMLILLPLLLMLAHCHLETELVKFQRLSHDPELTCILKSLQKFVKSQSRKKCNSFLKTVSLRSSAFFEAEDKRRQEVDSAKVMWRAHFDLLSDIDELNQCKSTMRLRAGGEEVSGLSESEAAFILDANNVNVEMMEHESKQAGAMAVLRRAKEKLSYLKNQRLREVSENCAPETCAVCLAALVAERSVLPCGHYFHVPCVDRLFKRSGSLETMRCPLRCPMPIKRQDILLASDKSKEDGSETSQKVVGSWGTKVNHIVSDVLNMAQMGEKGIIFSQWDEMIGIISAALRANKVSFIRPRSGKNFGADIKKFCCGCNIPILLMNVKNGAEGLTLTEANHVFLVEPILNCGLDMQAIGRVDRIGQTTQTFVHRYLIQDTVEEKIDKLRMERQEIHFENDLREQKKHCIKGGGIDGGFDELELRQLFG